MRFKKLISIVLVAVIFTAFTSVTANGAALKSYSLTQTVGSDSATITVEVPETVYRGKTFEMNIYLEGKYDGFAMDISEYTGISVSSVLTAQTCEAILTSSGWKIGTPSGFVRQSEAKTLVASVVFSVANNANLGDVYLDLDYITQNSVETDVNTNIAKITVAQDVSGYDINNDGEFTYLDVSKIYSCFRGISDAPQDVSLDINGDGNFTYLDVSKLYSIFRS